ncbi:MULTISPECIES: M91 family zinc metallopeptidase [unclassified Agarivorans]|uniref:M91 family zinc metallopeptidase n=1 Tax=unclassified Agarivorans TaxID=2636026 RepID=UPI003D7C5C11
MNDKAKKRQVVVGQAGKSDSDLHRHVRQHLRHIAAQPTSSSLQPPVIQKRRDAKSQLKPVTEISVAHIPSVSIIRDGAHAVYQTGSALLDFTLRAKRDLNLLLAMESGQKVFDTIHGSGYKVKIQDRGDKPKHGGSQKALDRLDAKTNGVGSDSLVPHQTDRSVLEPRSHAAPSSSVISLGHELIHATHSATGTLQSCKHDNYHVSPGVIKEERVTVGAADGTGGSNGLPTENSLRIDLAKQHQGITPTSNGQFIPRLKYGKMDLNF